MAADAGIEVDHQAKLLLRSVAGKCRSWRAPFRTAARRARNGRLRIAVAATSAFSIRTRRSNQAACPVTGSELAPAQAVALGGQQFVDQVVQQEALGGLRRVLVQRPGALALADGVPGPDRVFVQRGHVGDRHRDLRRWAT